jgi:hypothetical protein
MEKKQLLIICLVVLMIALTTDIKSINSVPLKEAGVKRVNKQNETGTEWNQTFGTFPSGEWADALIQTADGGFALAGRISAWDMWLVKTNANGEAQWTKRLGGTEWDEAYALVQTTEGGFALAGYTESYGAGDRDIWLVKTDANGGAQWNQTYGGEGVDDACALVQTTEGGFALAGYTGSFGAGNGDMWLIKTDADGKVEWDKTFGGSEGDGASSLIQTADGGFALAGYTGWSSAGNVDMWLVKTDTNGKVEWDKTFGGSENDGASSLTQTTDGGYALAGGTSSYGAGGEDMWLVKTDAHGDIQWNQTYGGVEADGASALVQTTEGGFALAGYTESYGAGDSDMWLVKSDKNGVIQWDQTFGDFRTDSALSLIQTAEGSFLLAGLTYSAGRGDVDMWLVKTEGQPKGQGIPGWETLPLLAIVIILSTWRKRRIS